MMPIEILEEEYVSHSASQPFSGMTLFGEMMVHDGSIYDDIFMMTLTKP